MRAATGTGRKTTNEHQQKYWGRLKKQFNHCQYDHTGAYSSFREPKSKEMSILQIQLEAVETILHTDKFKKMRGNGGFNDSPTFKYKNLK